MPHSMQFPKRFGIVSLSAIAFTGHTASQVPQLTQICLSIMSFLRSL